MSKVLQLSEPHPVAYDALRWIKVNHTLPELMILLEAFSSCAIENNRIGQICGETLRRIISGDKVSDRYVLGLAWYLAKQKGIKANEE